MDGDRVYECGIFSTLLKQPQMLKFAQRLSEHHFIYPYAPDYLAVFRRQYKKHGQLPNLHEFQRQLERDLLKRKALPEELDQAKEDAELIYGGEPTATTTEELIHIISEREIASIAEELSHVDLNKHDRLEVLANLRKRMGGLDSLTGATLDLGENIFLPGGVTAALQDHEVALGDLCVPTGWPRMDKSLWNGMAPGEVYGVMGPSGMGKSAVGVNISKNVLLLEPDGKRFLRRKRVAHLSTDDSPVMYKFRFFGSLTHTPTRKQLDAAKYEKKVAAAINDIEGRFFLRFVPNQTWRAADIEAWVVAIMESQRRPDLLKGIDPQLAGRVDLLVVDYAEKFLHEGPSTDAPYVKLHAFSEQMQRIALTYNMVILVLTQGNSQMAKVNFGQLTQGGGGYDKIKPFSGCWIICQSDAGHLMDPLEFWFHQAKDRRGDPGRLFPMFLDTSTQTIWENEREPVGTLSSHTKMDAKPTHEVDATAAAEHNKASIPKSKTNPGYIPEDEGEVTIKNWRNSQKPRRKPKNPVGEDTDS